MIYGSLIYTPGVETFCKRAAEAGVSGMIIPDLPFDYDEILDFYSRIYIISIGNKKALFNSWKKEFSTFYDDIKLKSNRCYNPTRIRVYVKENDKWHDLTDQYNNPNEDILKETLEHTVMIPIEILFYFEIPARTPKKIKVKI